MRQAEELVQKQEPDQALILVEQGLETARALSLETTSLAADLYQTRARIFLQLGDETEAIASFEKSLAVLRPLGPEEHRRLRQVTSELATLYLSQKQFALAIEGFRSALEMDTDVEKKETLDTAVLLHNLAAAYRDHGQLEEARLTFEKALEIKERLVTPQNPSVAVTLSGLAGVHRLQGRYSQAQILLERALEIQSVRRSTSPESYSRVLNNLGLVKEALGDPQSALQHYQESLEITVQVFGPHHPETLSPRINIAQLSTTLGDFERAEALYRETLDLATAVHGLDSLESASVAHNFGTLMYRMNDLEKARHLFDQALSVRRQKLGPNHPVLGPTLINLGSTYRKAGLYPKALELYREALVLGEANLGPDHPELAYTLDLITSVPNESENPEETAALIQRAYQIRLKAFGPTAPITADSLYALGRFHHRRGEYIKAESSLKSAYEIFEKDLGNLHPYTGQVAHHLGKIALEQGHLDKALSFARTEAEILQTTTLEIFSFASERQRLAYSQKLEPYNLFASLGAAEEVAEAVLRYKGSVQDSIMEDLEMAAQSADPETRLKVAELRQTKLALARALEERTETPSPKAVDEARVSKLRDKLETLETALARDGVRSQRLRRAFQVTTGEVSSALPQNAVLVEYLRYGKVRERGRVEQRYGAVVLSSKTEPTWLDLGSAAEIEKLAKRYRRFARGMESEVSKDGSVLKGLYQTTWKPIEQTLPTGTQTVVVSPDSDLNLLSFSTLLHEDGKFLGEHYNWIYVASGRDLLQQNTTRPKNEIVLFGDPLSPSSSYAPLPFTRVECDELNKIFKARRGLKVKTYIGPEATESRLKSVRQPKVLHIATHGYFEPQSETKNGDPMSRSGLILTPSRLANQSGNLTDDGYLTAGEVSLLDLTGTQLVTLSACDTGLGDIQAGEGVLGLRRGFLKSGASNLVMTLWPVVDQTTAAFMNDFYQRAQTTPPALALAQTQREWLASLREKHSRAEAVRLVGAFVLNLQGRWDSLGY